MRLAISASGILSEMECINIAPHQHQIYHMVVQLNLKYLTLTVWQFAPAKSN